MSQHGKALLVEAVEVEDGFGGGRCIPQHGVDRMTGQQRTRGVDDMDHRDVALLAADCDAPVAMRAGAVERPAWGAGSIRPRTRRSRWGGGAAR